MAEEKKPLQADTGAGRVAIKMDDEKCVSLRCLDPDALRRRCSLLHLPLLPLVPVPLVPLVIPPLPPPLPLFSRMGLSWPVLGRPAAPSSVAAAAVFSASAVPVLVTNGVSDSVCLSQ